MPDLLAIHPQKAAALTAQLGPPAPRRRNRRHSAVIDRLACKACWALLARVPADEERSSGRARRRALRGRSREYALLENLVSAVRRCAIRRWF
jgi:hypothetical protein